MADSEDQERWKLYRNLYRRLIKAKEKNDSESQKVIQEVFENLGRKIKISEKGMSDFTAGYDPTKPLDFEPLIGSISESSLIFDQDDNITDKYLFYSGDPVEDKNYDLIFRIDMREIKLKEQDIIDICFSGMIVNKKVLMILNKICPNDFQAFPVTIKNRFNKKKSKTFINQDYTFIYPIKKIKALDYEQSKFYLINDSEPVSPSNILRIQQLRFKSKCMDGVDLAKDINRPTLILISQRLFHILRDENIRGAEFLPDYLSMYDRNNYLMTEEK